MSSSTKYAKLEKESAKNFRCIIEKTNVNHVVYLSGIINDNNLSKHLSSRKEVEIELSKGSYHFTTLRAGIIIGSGSASFEIIRDLVEKLPIMIAPKWLKTRCQPVGITDVIAFLSKTIFNSLTFNKNFDIGSPDILTYKEMLLEYARSRRLKRFIFTIPIMSPKLSSYWLYFVTATSYKLAIALVDSMKVEVVCRNNKLSQLLGIKTITYRDSLEKAFSKIQDNAIVSSWKDSMISGRLNIKLSDFLDVPKHGCFKDTRTKPVINREKTLNKIWMIGGNVGWYYGTWLWKLRGFIDKLFGGVGLRRGRTHQTNLLVGDAVDFWRVLYSNKQEGRLLLFAEMRLPGEAWLEFRLVDNFLTQTATFRPKGIGGRLYWYFVYPFHGFIFNGLANKLIK